MKKLFKVILLISILSITVQSQPISLKADQDSVLANQLSDLEFTLNKLLADRDYKTYAAYLADDYVRISANGEMKTKDQVLREFGNYPPGEAVPEIRQIRIYGNTAIMNIHLKITREDSGKKVTRESLLTKVFISRGGHWLMVSNQGTPLGQEKIQ